MKINYGPNDLTIVKLRTAKPIIMHRFSATHISLYFSGACRIKDFFPKKKNKSLN